MIQNLACLPRQHSASLLLAAREDKTLQLRVQVFSGVKILPLGAAKLSFRVNPSNATPALDAVLRLGWVLDCFSSATHWSLHMKPTILRPYECFPTRLTG